MILFINTSKTDLIQIKLIKDGQIISQLETHEEYKQSELLLGMIEKISKEQKASLNYARGGKSKIFEAIAVVSGPGAFSALRLGVTTANALAWSLGIPIIELSTDEAGDDQNLIKSINERVARAMFKPISPKYGREPNITKAK